MIGTSDLFCSTPITDTIGKCVKSMRSEIWRTFKENKVEEFQRDKTYNRLVRNDGERVVQTDCSHHAKDTGQEQRQSAENVEDPTVNLADGRVYRFSLFKFIN